MGTSCLPAVALFDNFWAPTLAFAHSLGRRGIPLHVYGAGAARWSRFCRRRDRSPPVENAELFLPWLQRQIRSGAIERVAPTTDLIAYYTSYLRGEFAPQVQRSIAPLEEIEAALIKSRFATACTAAGQLVPRTMTPTDLEDALRAAQELRYPLILKPKSHLAVGFAERGHLIHDAAELRARFRPYTPAPGQAMLAQRYPELLWPLLQCYVASARRQVYSLSGFKDPEHGIVAAALSCKVEQWPPDIGTSTLQVSSNESSILQAAVRTVARLPLRGIFELELLVDADRLLAIDLNPRAFGFINLDIARGHDLPWLWFRSTLEPLRPQPLPLAAQLEARHVLLHLLKRLGRGATAARTGQRAWVSMVGHRGDPLPMLLSYAMVLRNPRSLLRTALACSPPAR